ELFKTAVTLGESAYASCALAKTPRTANNLRQCVRISINYQPSIPAALPVLIDMARCSAFIKLNPRLLVFHRFQKRLGLAFAHLARVRVVDLVACRRPAKEKESRQVAPVFFAVRSSPELGRFFPVADLSDFQTCLVIADLGAAAGLSVAPRPDLVVAVDSVVA